MTPAIAFQSIQKDIAETAQRCRRSSEEITLVAVSKNCTLEEMEAVWGAGCRNFGESRIQEALPKIAQMQHPASWHFVGSLQTNKARKAALSFSLIHSVDTLRLAQILSNRGLEIDRPISILLEICLTQEVGKKGFSLEELFRHWDALLCLPGICIEGLMTIAPLTSDKGLISRCFSELYVLREQLSARKIERHPLKHLSMGMSNDYKLAIAEGATLLRIGKSIFKNQKNILDK